MWLNVWDFMWFPVRGFMVLTLISDFLVVPSYLWPHIVSSYLWLHFSDFRTSMGMTFSGFDFMGYADPPLIASKDPRVSDSPSLSPGSPRGKKNQTMDCIMLKLQGLGGMLWLEMYQTINDCFHGVKWKCMSSVPNSYRLFLDVPGISISSYSYFYLVTLLK